MTDLEQRLRGLADLVEWPETPPLAVPAASPGRARATGRRLPRRRTALAIAAALLAAAAVAMAVPGARSAILDWLHVGGVAIERVDRLPPTVPASALAALGEPVDAARAAATLGAPFRRPDGVGSTALRRAGDVVSTVLATADGPVLLSELRSGAPPYLLKKLAASTRVDLVQVGSVVQGAWLSGAPHVVIGFSAPPRLAGNVLVWEHDGITYRLEGAVLRRSTALDLARRILAA